MFASFRFNSGMKAPSPIPVPKDIRQVVPKALEQPSKQPEKQPEPEAAEPEKAIEAEPE